MTVDRVRKPLLEIKWLALALGCCIVGSAVGYLISEKLPKKWSASLELTSNPDILSAVISQDDAAILTRFDLGVDYLRSVEKELVPENVISLVQFELQKPVNVFAYISNADHLSVSEKSTLERQYYAGDIFRSTLIEGYNANQSRIKVEFLSEIEDPQNILEDYLAMCVNNVSRNLSGRIEFLSKPLLSKVASDLAVMKRALDFKEFKYELPDGVAQKIPMEYVYSLILTRDHINQDIEAKKAESREVHASVNSIKAKTNANPLLTIYSPLSAPLKAVFPNTFLLMFLGAGTGLCAALSVIAYKQLKK